MGLCTQCKGTQPTLQYTGLYYIKHLILWLFVVILFSFFIHLKFCLIPLQSNPFVFNFMPVCVVSFSSRSAILSFLVSLLAIFFSFLSFLCSCFAFCVFYDFIHPITFILCVVSLLFVVNLSFSCLFWGFALLATTLVFWTNTLKHDSWTLYTVSFSWPHLESCSHTHSQAPGWQTTVNDVSNTVTALQISLH